MRRLAVSTACLALLAASARATAAPAAPATALADRAFDFHAGSIVTYTLVHPLHRVVGGSHALAGRVTWAGDRLALPLDVRLPLATFGSGNANRDANAATTLEVGRFPAARLAVRRFAETSRAPLPGGAWAVTGEAGGRLELHGVAQDVTIPIRARLAPDGLTVDASFGISLTTYGIPRPALFFKPVEDLVAVTIHGLATPAAR